jgi:Zn finger protein HypA/HybF involved in hydrogenase expression
MAGYFAMLYDDDGPIDTGIGRYATIDGAKAEAISWSRCEGVPVDFNCRWCGLPHSGGPEHCKAAEGNDVAEKARHSWVRIREHNYMCKKCGMGKINIQVGDKEWEQNYLFPDGTEGRRSRVPPCAPGVFTESRVARLEALPTTDGLDAAREKIAENKGGDSVERVTAPETPEAREP